MEKSKSNQKATKNVAKTHKIAQKLSNNKKNMSTETKINDDIKSKRISIENKKTEKNSKKQQGQKIMIKESSFDKENINKSINRKVVEDAFLNTKQKFDGKNIFAIMLVFVLTVFAVFSVVISGNLSVEPVVTANITNTRIVQAKLASLGYYNQDIDGIYDNATIDAIKSYQADKNLVVTGSLDEATTTALGVTDNTQANTDLYLLAKLIYSEARGEIYEGQVAVGAVVLNRVDDAGFPNTLQGVIYQPWAFTALHDGQFNLEPNGTAYQAAQDAMNGWDPTYGCLFYYNPRTATSSWIFSREIIVTIGNHVFCL